MAHTYAADSKLAWPDAADEIIGGDQAVVMAHVTPAHGVVLTPLTNFGIRDRAAGTMTPLNSSVAMWRKLERVRRNPQIAVAYHTRAHSYSEREEYVLVQGRATVSSPADRDWVERHREAFERFGGELPGGRVWDWWLRAFHWRVGIEIAVERVVVWPDLACRGAAQVCGAPLPAQPPASQRAPAGGTGSRIDHRRAAERARRLPNVLLGWVGADGFPVVVPVAPASVEPDGIVLETPPDLVPPGARRAGLTAHSFTRYTYGQHQRIHTGWLEAGAGRVLYAPHTERGYHLPESRLLFPLVAGFGTRWKLRDARRAGFLEG